MEFKCFIKKCSHQFIDTMSYRTHIRVIHKYTENNNYVCTFYDCKRTFNDIKGLLKHLNLFHKVKKSENINLQEENENINLQEENQNAGNFNNVTLTEKSQEINIEQLNETDESQQDKINLESESNLQDRLEEIFFHFLLDLHKKGNLTKSGIRDIFKSIKCNILDKICVLCKIDESFLDVINLSYQKLCSQYKFDKKLNSRGMISNGSIFLKLSLLLFS